MGEGALQSGSGGRAEVVPERLSGSSPALSCWTEDTRRPRSLLRGLFACRCKCGRERCSPWRTAGSAAGAGRPARARREGRRWRLTAPTCRLRLTRPAAAPPTRTAASLLSRLVRPRVPVDSARSRRAEHRPRTAAAERQRCRTNRTSTSASREQAPLPPSRSHPLLPPSPHPPPHTSEPSPRPCPPSSGPAPPALPLPPGCALRAPAGSFFSSRSASRSPSCRLLAPILSPLRAGRRLVMSGWRSGSTSGSRPPPTRASSR